MVLCTMPQCQTTAGCVCQRNLRPLHPRGWGLRVLGVSRDAGHPHAVSVALSGPPSDDDLRDLHDYLREWRR